MMNREKLSIDLFFLVMAFGMGPFYIFPKDRWLWILPIFTIICAGRWFLDSKGFRSSPINGAVALLIVSIFFGVLSHSNIAPSTAKLAGLSYGILVFLIVLAYSKSENRIKIIVVMFLLGGLIVAGIGTISRSEGTSIPQIDSSPINRIVPKVLMKIDRAEAGISPNPLAGTLLLFVPPGMITLCFFLKKKKERVKPNLQYPIIGALLVVLIAEIAAVLYARSFGAWLAIMTIFLLMGKKRRLLKSVVGMVVISALILIIKSPQYSKNAYIMSVREALRVSAVDRIPYWKAGLEAARGNPLFGLGLDRLRETPPMTYESAHAHNQFIHTAAEMGIPALIAYLAILIGAGWMTIEVIRSKMPEWMILIMRGLAWGQIGFGIFGIADAIPLGSKPGLFFWISLALMTSIYLYGRENDMIEKMNKNVEATV